jgi:hypothetical protein
MSMRYCVHAMRIAGALAIGLSLTACESFQNLFDNKKPLPGERKPVFTQGVPGIPQGVPPELVRGYQPPPEQQPSAVVETPVEKPAEKPKPRPAPRATTVAVPSHPPATSITVQPNANAPPASSWPAPPATQQTQQPQQQPAQQSSQQSPPPASSWPASPSAPGGAQAPTPWPSAPPPGTFSR